MRIDKFLNATNILKRRSMAKDLLENHLVSINGSIIKASKNVKVGDIIEIRFLEYSKKYEVLMIAITKTLPKNQKQEYVKEIKDN